MRLLIIFILNFILIIIFDYRQLYPIIIILVQNFTAFVVIKLIFLYDIMRFGN